MPLSNAIPRRCICAGATEGDHGSPRSSTSSNAGSDSPSTDAIETVTSRRMSEAVVVSVENDPVGTWTSAIQRYGSIGKTSTRITTCSGSQVWMSVPQLDPRPGVSLGDPRAGRTAVADRLPVRRGEELREKGDDDGKVGIARLYCATVLQGVASARAPGQTCRWTAWGASASPQHAPAKPCDLSGSPHLER